MQMKKGKKQELLSWSPEMIVQKKIVWQIDWQKFYDVC